MIDRKGRKALVILSDGLDLRSEHTFEEALRMAYKAEMTIYAISTGTRQGLNSVGGYRSKFPDGDKILRRLAENTGGRFFHPRSPKHLTAAFRRINEELRNQYNLAYLVGSQKKDGRFRKIKVKVKRGRVKIRHRKGYFAPVERRGWLLR